MAVDLCSGAGGWEVAADELGLDVLGIELDDAPVAVARAAGHRVLQADIATLDPLGLPCTCEHTAEEVEAAGSPWHRPGCPSGTVTGLCGSPPCTSYSSAGRGAGRGLAVVVLGAIADLAAGRDTRSERRAEAYTVLEPTARFDLLPTPRRRRKREQRAASPMARDRIARRMEKRATAKQDAAVSLLVVEPLRWALALEPRWIALEQVPPVLPIWEAMAAVLRERGYSVWTGCLSAERYGTIATCPIHERRPASSALDAFAVANLATADPAQKWPESAASAQRRSAFATALDSVGRVPNLRTSDHRRPAQTASGPSCQAKPATAAHAGMPLDGSSASNRVAAEPRLKSETAPADAGSAKTLPGTTAWPTEALSDAWTVANLARAAMDAAGDATWRVRVFSLLSRALPARRTHRGRAVDGWMSAAMSGDGWADADGENITWSPSVFWAALCGEAKSYITSTTCPTTTTPTTSGSSRPTATTCTTTTAERSRASCSLCDDTATPQTRQRAILIASLDHEVREPPATHQRYIAPRKRATDGEAATLFEAPESERIVHREDRDLLPWVSMAECLSWGMSARPSVSLLAKTGGTGGHRPLEGGSGARETLARAREDGAWVLRAGTNERDCERPADTPAPTIRFGPKLNGVAWVQRSNYSDSGPAGTTAEERGRTERPLEAPSVALTSKGFQWMRSGQSVAGEGRAERSVEDPSLSVIPRFDLCEWVTERPSTSVNCDPRVAEPGRHDPDESGSQYGAATVRVSVEEAAALQSFPPGYPWEAAGTRTAAFKAVGNAIPPLLALHILTMATGAARQERDAA